jgi:protein arginine kinase
MTGFDKSNLEQITRLPYAAWVEPTDERQIVLSSRLRLARNLSGRPFPNRLSDKEAEALGQEVAAKLPPEENWRVLHLDELMQTEKGVLLEKHLLSRDILQHEQGRMLAVNAEQTLAVMINEEDHLRMQAILPGLQLEAGWKLISGLDDRLAEQLDFAYDDKLGFLTACPSNLGTGLRASVMLHLPALSLTGQLDGIFRQLPQAGLTVRGVYGEGSQSQSGLYQISNQITLGYSEDEIISRLQQLVEAIIAQEIQAREWLLQNRPLWLKDQIGRACGTLANAYLLTSKEAMECISLVRLGVAMGLCDKISYRELNLLMLSAQTPFLQAAADKELAPQERDKARAELARKFMH